MSKILTLTLNIPQPTIKVAVEFYNSDEEKKLLKYPTAAKIAHIVKTGLEVPIEEFLTYYLFHRKRPGKEGWRNYHDVGTKIGIALADLADWIEFNGESISTPTDAGGQERSITERIGESIGLSVISQIHGLTAADWERIPIRPYSTFDYQIASDGKHIIQMEAKGSSTPDNTVKTPSISQHKSNIAGKKKQIQQLEASNSYKYPADLRYATITVVGESEREPVRCWLVDPPADGDGTTAAKFRLLQRMRFLTDWITFVSPRSQLASALQTRLSTLEHLPDPFILDGISLMKGNGKRFEFSPFSGILGGHSSFFASKSKITDGPAGGVVVPLPDGNLFMLGIRENVVQHVANQDVRHLIDFKEEHGIMRKTVECTVTERAFNEWHLPKHLVKDAEPHGGYYRFERSGQIQYSSSGILFGVLPTEDDQ